MTGILVTPPELRSKAAEIRERAKAVQVSVDEVDAQVNALGPSVYEGHSADQFRTHYSQMRERVMAFRPFLERFATMLEETATAFEQADKTS